MRQLAYIPMPVHQVGLPKVDEPLAELWLRFLFELTLGRPNRDLSSADISAMSLASSRSGCRSSELATPSRKARGSR